MRLPERHCAECRFYSNVQEGFEEKMIISFMFYVEHPGSSVEDEFQGQN